MAHKPSVAARLALAVPCRNAIRALITRILCARVGGREQIRWQVILSCAGVGLWSGQSADWIPANRVGRRPRCCGRRPTASPMPWSGGGFSVPSMDAERLVPATPRRSDHAAKTADLLCLRHPARQLRRLQRQRHPTIKARTIRAGVIAGLIAWRAIVAIVAIGHADDRIGREIAGMVRKNPAFRPRANRRTPGLRSWNIMKNLERAMGFEPTTSTLARL